MDQAFGVEIVMLNIPLDVHFILSHMGHLPQHIRPLFSPRKRCRICDSDLPEQRVSVTILHANVHKLVSVGELGHKNALEVTLNLSLSRGGHGVQMLQHTNQ